MNRNEAENLVYESYLSAETRQKDEGVRMVRDPTLLAHILSSFPDTPCAVVTGSKGKGSLCMMLSSILSKRVRTGMLTSPHITRFNERIRVDAESIPDEDFTRIISNLEPELRRVSENLPEGKYISPIGIQAAAALTYFSEKGTGFNVLECGKGAKYDDINQIPHKISLINRIFLEHSEELGPTIRDIAENKSHVITKDCEIAFTARQKPEAMEVIRSRAEDLGIPLWVYGEDYKAESITLSERGTEFKVICGDRIISEITLPLLGRHMVENAAMAVAAALHVYPDLSDSEIRDALGRVKWPGRMEILRKEPLTILDACINRSSCDQVIETMRILGIEKPDLIIGIPDDKDFSGVAEAMAPYANDIILTRSSNRHYTFTERQKEILSRMNIACRTSSGISEALKLIEGSRPVVILGTTSLISDTEQLFHR